MRVPIARRVWSLVHPPLFFLWRRRRAAAMLRPPISSSSSKRHSLLFTCCLYMHSDSYAIAASTPPPPPPPSAMLDQAQRGRMARNKEQALRRLHKKGYFAGKTSNGDSQLSIYYEGCQRSSLPDITGFLRVSEDRPIALNTFQETKDMQSNLLSSPSNIDRGLGVFASNITQDIAFVEGETDLIIHKNQKIGFAEGETDLIIHKNQELEPVSLRRTQKFDYVVVVDFEATCDKNMENLKPQEIIEFPSVLVDCQQLTLQDCFQTYVKPEHHPTLTAFCTHLTGIQQEQVDKGISLKEAIHWHDKWLEEKGIKKKNFAVLIWSDWDCKVMLEDECKLKGLNKPHYFNRWINLKVLFQNTFNGRKCNLRRAVEVSGLKWTGRAHCGLDDAKNTARLALELMRRGTILTITGSMPIVELRRPDQPSEAVQAKSESLGVPKTSNRSTHRCVNVGLKALQCYCGVTCKKHMVKKPGPTNGKFFLACGRWTPTDGSRCGFFEWAAGS